MLEDLARLPPNVGASVERALVEAERTLAVAETQPPDYVFSGGTRASDIAVPTVLGVVAVGVDGLNAHARTHLWSATTLRVAVEQHLIPSVARHLFDTFTLRHTPFEMFRREVVVGARETSSWRAYQAALDERNVVLAFFEQLEALRREAGVTVETLCAEAGLSSRTYYTWRDPNVEPEQSTKDALEGVLTKRLRRPIRLP
jgi:DNA-binding XRE family transcriptional regulator